MGFSKKAEVSVNCGDDCPNRTRLEVVWPVLSLEFPPPTSAVHLPFLNHQHKSAPEWGSPSSGLSGSPADNDCIRMRFSSGCIICRQCWLSFSPISEFQESINKACGENWLLILDVLEMRLSANFNFRSRTTACYVLNIILRIENKCRISEN